MAQLGTGHLIIAPAAGGERVYFVDRGHIEVREDKVAVLLETFEELGDIDINRAKEAQKRALGDA